MISERNRQQTRDVRMWADRNGYRLGSRIPAYVLDAYRADPNREDVMAEQKPSVGRVVHYVSRGSLDGKFPPACRAATITEVRLDHGEVRPDAGVGLCVQNPTGLFFHPIADLGGCEHDPGQEPDEDEGSSSLCGGAYHEPGTWHWPARV